MNSTVGVVCECLLVCNGFQRAAATLLAASACPSPRDHWRRTTASRQFCSPILASSLRDASVPAVVVYDANALSATRLWWAMQYHGHESVRLLAGGWHRWVEEGRPVEATPPVVGSRAAEPFVSQPRSAHIALAGDVLDVIRDSQELPAGSSGRKRKPQLVDVRTRLEYEGLDARGNPRAGRIPGSVHLDHAALLSPERRTFKALDEMAAVVDQVGLHRDKPVLVYCQAGIRAANTAFALRLLGFDDVAVFDGSMAEWLADDSLPLESETPADGPGSGGLGDA